MLNSMRKQYNVLCRPAQIYILISLIAVLAMLVQNVSNPKKYCVGKYSCDLNFSNLFIFAGKLLYIAIWTIILNSLCDSGYKELSWVIVLIPIVLFFLLVGLFLVSNMK